MSAHVLDSGKEKLRIAAAPPGSKRKFGVAAKRREITVCKNSLGFLANMGYLDTAEVYGRLCTPVNMY